MSAASRILSRLFLLRFAVLGDWTANRVQYALTILGIALGIAVFVAVETANVTIRHSFARSQGYLPGRPALHVEGGKNGLDERILAQVEAHPAVEQANPLLVIPCVLEVKGRKLPFQVYGADLVGAANLEHRYPIELAPHASYLSLILDPRSLLVTRSLAAEEGLVPGTAVVIRYQGRRIRCIIQGTIQSPPHVTSGNRYGVMDIAWVQERFGKVGRLDRIDLVLKPGADPRKTAQELRKRLPPFVSVYSAETARENLTELVSSFQLNITALSLISLLVGMFLIYNTIFISYIRKRRQIGILRALGVTRRGIFWIFSCESLFYGTAGGVLGTAFGYALSFLTIHSLATTVNTLYTRVEPSQVVFSWKVMAEGLFMGVAASFVSSFFPAREAARTPQAETLKPGTYEIRFRETHARLLPVGLVLLALSALLSLQGPVGGIPLCGYGATMTIMLGMACITPSLLGPASNALYRPFARRLGAEGFMAMKNLGRNLGRSSVILCAIMVSLGMMVSFVFMTHSFRTSLKDLIDQVVRFQFYVVDRYRIERGVRVPLPQSAIRRIRSIPGVSCVEGYTILDQPFRNRTFVLMSATLETYRRYDQIRFLRGDKKTIYQRAEKGGILISEALASRYSLHENDPMELATPRGTLRTFVAGIFYNYQFDRGLAYLDRPLFERWYPSREVSGIYVYVDKPADRAAVHRRLVHDVAAPLDAAVITQKELKRYIMRAFDQTFAITYALQLIAVIVAVLAIVNTLSSAILERRREIGILRAMGFLRRRIRKMVLIEAGIVGSIGCFLGILTGFMVSLILIFVINKQSFGWSIEFHLPLGAVVRGALIVFAATVGAGVFPAAHAARTNLTEAFRYE